VRRSGPTIVAMPALVPVLLAVHIALAVSLVAPAADERTWVERARRQRYVSYAMVGLVGTIGVLMSSKPALW
jgi:hypothetical protein